MEFETIADQRLQLAQAQAETARAHALLNIFKTVIDGERLANNQANESLLESLLNPGESLSAAWFIELVKDSRYRSRFLWEEPTLNSPARRKAKLAEDRQTFKEACRKYDISETTANLKLTVEMLGAGFDVYAVGEAIKAGRLLVSPATPQELREWESEATQQRQNWLRNEASPMELRQAAKQESIEGHAQAAREEDQRQLKIRQEREAQVGYPPLPEVDQNNNPLNSAFFKRLSNTDLGSFRKYIKNYGSFQITQALRERF